MQVKERSIPIALDHLTHLWQYFRKGNDRFRGYRCIRMVTGRDPQTLEEFFRANAKAIGLDRISESRGHQGSNFRRRS